MAVKIRLQRKGRKKKPFYHIVIADARAPRDGKYIERIGSYNPITNPATITLDRDRAFEWLNNGAQPTHTARAILKLKGVLYRKHLMRGVKKGSITEDQANQMYQEFILAKEDKMQSRFDKEKEEKMKSRVELMTSPILAEELKEEDTPTVSESDDNEENTDTSNDEEQ